ncbi:MAG TPA: pyrimidine dimer DNA glycosylase/endonuclease V [Povalibacter sp.]|uniref:pyrimidine dimer DNA glycosylase/endonuclease V n=1 Tax=Povalibacter sp. TaxID=1962978 RepID=UPI002B8D3409|nr:pyrimidine dimer DNA glycosylase/endonuclease V [Povalibacter sp.]HMN45996.1 pyrimidine dimer DNA glycosylase/endonuclease V [Povalibacter sp.]
MRLWSLHPRYLDPQGLVALWRETLLAQAVLRGETRGYRHHPQLDRFRNHPAPLSAISLYLRAIHAESVARGYSFDERKIRPARRRASLAVTTGQMSYEWKHLLGKLKQRSPALHRQWRTTETPQPHPLFKVRAGEVESWERP